MLKVKNTPHAHKRRTPRPPVHKSVATCLKVPDIASILGISRASAYELANSNGFPRIVMGKRLIIPRRAFMEWMEANTVTEKQPNTNQLGGDYL